MAASKLHIHSSNGIQIMNSHELRESMIESMMLRESMIESNDYQSD